MLINSAKILKIGYKNKCLFIRTPEGKAQTIDYLETFKLRELTEY